MRDRRVELMAGGGCLVIVMLVAFTITYWLYASPTARRGRQFGYNPPTYTVVRTIQQHASAGQGLSPVEVAALRGLARDDNWQVRCRALSALYATRGTPQMTAAAEIARDRLADPEWVVRVYATSALARMGAPDAQQVAKKMLSDRNASVRQNARRILNGGR